MVCIETKYLGPTDSQGSRIKATANGHSIIVPYSYDSQCPYEKAAYALCEKLKWSGKLIGGTSKIGKVFVFQDTKTEDILLWCHKFLSGQFADADIEAAKKKIQEVL